MVNTSTGSNMMSSTTAKTAVKRVAKKETVAESVVAAAPVVTATPVATPVAAPVATTVPVAAAPEKTSKRVAKKSTVAETVATPVEVSAPSAAPVNDVVPDASAVATVEAVGPTTSVQQDIDALTADVQAVRDSASTVLKALQRLSKRVARDLKAAGRRRRARRSEDAGSAEREKRPTIFKTPVPLKNELCSFLGKANGTQMAPADVTKAFSAYVETHGLKNAEKGQGHTIHPNAAMRKLFGLAEGETVSYRNVQKHLYKLYDLPKRAAATASTTA